MSRALVALTIRPLSKSDRPLIEAMTRACGVFREDEVRVALDVLDAALGLDRRRDPDYETVGVELDGGLAGWACWGPVPCTVGTFDLYWIVVAPEWQGHGVGGALIEEAERRVAGRARMIVVETAGREEYAGTRGFYLSRGYRVAARIADYYAAGDDLVVYVKRIQDSGIRAQGPHPSLTPDS
ncbi:MAG TPA: GNAT family N-acetyltransferase [Gemmatimonadales bacterium]|jgi:ribosomal protein S18 acetylase RimI-like enzyme|nr:GNAT family N-acetyltransferase [Gemmatimonadales bacterium]